MMCVVYVSVTKGDGCVVTLALCKYDLRKGDLFAEVSKGMDE